MTFCEKKLTCIGFLLTVGHVFMVSEDKLLELLVLSIIRIRGTNYGNYSALENTTLPRQEGQTSLPSRCRNPGGSF